MIIGIGLGHRARQGKDVTANFIKELRDDVLIYHFADALYEEVENKRRDFPLITMINDTTVSLLDNFENGKRMVFAHADVEFPQLLKIMRERYIREYWGSEHKDPEMLQFWGTNFRRMKCDKDYWVNQVGKKIQNIIDFDSTNPVLTRTYVVIPDTRFLNELAFLRGMKHDGKQSGFYVKVLRYDSDGNQYIDPSRDKNHPSEVELQGVPADFEISAGNGKVSVLKSQIQRVLYEIDERLVL